MDKLNQIAEAQKDFIDNNAKSINKLEEQIDDLKNHISDVEFKMHRKGHNTNSPINLTNGKQQKQNKTFKIKEWVDSGVKDYSTFTKGLSLNGNEALYEADLNILVLEQSIVNNAILDAIGRRSTENLDYRRTVLTQRPEVQLTKENITFSAVSETTAADYASIAGLYTKAFAFPRLTNEVMKQGDVDVEGNLLKLLSEQFSITMQEQILHGDGLRDVDQNQHLKGITNAAIDRANAYVEALKPAATRDRETFAAVKANAADIGTSSSELEAFLYTLMLTVPERSQATSMFAMNQNTLSYLMQTLKDTQGRSLIQMELLQEKGVWVRRINLFGANIILNETIDDIGAGNAPIIFGDFKAGYELLTTGNGSHFVTDQVTIPDTVGFYQDMYFGSTVADHEALAVLVCTA
ncbi:phage major capsid protein [Vibrio sp. T187]|uniref:phage major capsid protein n=1 Tax=Vibrio TaxID=662 RepID=UPI0010C96C3E|nr:MULTISPECIES: phage major capsid protein [Vibrio]MBW3696460.1 phage major capsid protein [Vibrio sp. T187]